MAIMSGASRRREPIKPSSHQAENAVFSTLIHDFSPQAFAATIICLVTRILREKV
jgi:hypothetical protein